MNSLKITLESPIGVKANLKKMMLAQNRIWQFDTDTMKKVNKEWEYSKLVISLMHFHSMLTERKNYGPLGWNIKYNFNDSDFLISKNIIKNSLQGSQTIPYKAINYLTADCIYGGRVTDDWDRRLVNLLKFKFIIGHCFQCLLIFIMKS